MVEDADELAAIFADSRLYVFTGGDPSTLEALCSTFARLADARTASDTAQLNWVVRRRGDDQAIGMLQAIFTDGGHAAEIGAGIGVPWQGQDWPRKQLAPWSPGWTFRASRPLRPGFGPTTTPRQRWPFELASRQPGVPRHRATSRAAMAPPVAEPLGV